MLRLVISGCNGYMGKVVAEIAESDPDITIAAGFDVNTDTRCAFPVFTDPAEFSGRADAVVDFSAPQALGKLLEYGVRTKTPLILCTTGYSPEQLKAVGKAAEQIPVFKSANMSLGINLLADLIKRACTVLGDAYDVEIVERHHRRKVDAPSGTALMLADAAASALPHSSEYVFERQSKRQQRETAEIGISSVRGGTIVGQHEVIFAGLDEVIELKHTAASRDIFAAGAIKAAKFICNVYEPGLYDMSDVLKAMKKQGDGSFA